MSISTLRKRLLHFFCMALMALLLAACGGEDKPFSLVGDQNQPQPGANPGSSATPPPSSGGCYVNFNATMQLKISAQPSGGTPLNKLDAKPVNVSGPIPLRVDGNNIIMEGDKFPPIIINTLGDGISVDIKIIGTPGNQAIGTYDSATGKITLEGFDFGMQLLKKGTTDLFLESTAHITGVDFTTESVTAKGNLNDITETGSPLDKNDKSLILVAGVRLPATFAPLNVMDTYIAGGALTAKFEGILDNLPENCTSGGTPGGGNPGGGNQGPSEFSISVGSDTNAGQVDFGTTPVIVKKVGDDTILDCSDASNRGVVYKKVTIKNTGDGDRKIKILEPNDTDGDKKDPLCSGSAEFVRGSVTVEGNAKCEKVTVAGKEYLTGECTIPKDSNSAVSFPLMYVPFNYVRPSTGESPAATPSATPAATPSAGAEAVVDTGNLKFEYDSGKEFLLKLSGRTIPDTRDVFSVSKIKDETESAKEIKNTQLIKISLKSGDTKPFTQKLVLKNSGDDSWEEVTFKIEKDGAVFSVPAPSTPTLPASTGSGLGKLQFSLVFNPGAENAYNDTLTITMVKSGSKTAANPEGTKTTLSFPLLGTSGLPPLTGNVKFQVDFLTGKIDHSITVDPVESLDFRAYPEQAPPPLDLVFADTVEDEIKSVTLNLENKDVSTKSKADRMTSLRILNAQATVGKSGQHLKSGNSAELCNEAENILITYDDSRQECAYFYFGLSGNNPGTYDDDSGDLTLPEINLRIQNPYHSDIAGNKWPKSNPGGNPDYVLDTNLEISLTTFLLDDKNVETGGKEVVLVPDGRISKSQLNVKGKSLGKPCTEDILNHDPSVGSLADKHPHLLCYLSSDGKYLQGRNVALRPNQTKEYDVILVGVGQFPPASENPDLPWFMGEEGGSRIYVVIQGRLYLE